MKRLLPAIILTIICLSSTANAALVTRLGGQAVYDTDLDITWLSDSNAASGTVFDDGFSNTDGRMTWESASNWSASLAVGGFNDWRLPTSQFFDHLYFGELGGTAPFISILDSGDPDLAKFNLLIDTSYWTSQRVQVFPSEPLTPLFFSFNGGFTLDFTSHQSNFRAFAIRSGDVSTVPAPATLLLALTGLGLAGFGRRKHN